MENFEHDVALHYCETALAVTPSNVEVLETTGGLLLEMGDIKKAIEISLYSVRVALSLERFQNMIPLIN